MVLALFSCNSSDPDDDNSTLSLVGDWELVDWYDDSPRDINGDGEATTDLWSQWDGCRKHTILTLMEDGTSMITYTGPDDNPRCPPGRLTDHMFNIEPWEVDEGNTEFTLVGDDTFDTYEIVEFTSDDLVLEGSGFLTCCDAFIGYYTAGFLRFERK